MSKKPKVKVSYNPPAKKPKQTKAEKKEKNAKKPTQGPVLSPEEIAARKKKNRIKNALLVLALLVLILIVLIVWVFRLGYYWEVGYARSPEDGADFFTEYEETREWTTDTDYAAEELEDAFDAWRYSRLPKDVYITTDDDVTLHADLYDEDSNVTVILLNGYAATADDDFLEAAYYGSLGYNVLMVEQRAHGESEGEFFSYGLCEADDLQDWISYIEDLYGDDTQIIIHGKYTGANIALMAASDGLSDSVAFIVADSAYTNMYDVGVRILKLEIEMPKWPFYMLTNYYFEKKDGYSIEDVEILSGMGSVTTPVIFVCDSADQYILAENTEELYAACGSADTELLVIDGAGFNDTYIYGTDEIESLLDAWIDSYITVTETDEDEEQAGGEAQEEEASDE